MPVDEFISGFGKKIDVTIDANHVRVRDYGRGVPLGKIVECVSVINTGAKYNDDVFQFSVGLNGVGSKAVNALSTDFRVVAYRDGRYAEARFTRGKLIREKKGRTQEPDGSLFEFTPDPEIFEEYDYNFEYVERRMWNYACLNSGLTLVFNKQKFVSKRGLLDFLSREVDDSALYEPAYYKGQYLEFAFTHTSNYGENYFSFVNGQYTIDGGTHQSAFREGILKGVNEFYKKNYSGVDVRESINGAVAVKLKEPIFESQTKNKLGNTEVRSWIVSETRSAVVDFLHKNTAAAQTPSGEDQPQRTPAERTQRCEEKGQRSRPQSRHQNPAFQGLQISQGRQKNAAMNRLFLSPKGRLLPGLWSPPAMWRRRLFLV